MSRWSFDLLLCLSRFFYIFGVTKLCLWLRLPSTSRVVTFLLNWKEKFILINLWFSFFLQLVCIYSALFCCMLPLYISFCSFLCYYHFHISFRSVFYFVVKFKWYIFHEWSSPVWILIPLCVWLKFKSLSLPIYFSFTMNLSASFQLPHRSDRFWTVKFRQKSVFPRLS